MVKKGRHFTFTMTDDESGQAIKGRFIPYSQGGRFMKLWQGTGWEKRIMSLQGNSVKVLWHLVSVASWGNQVPGPTEVAKAMNIKKQNISRAYAELIKSDFLYKVDGAYCLSPFFCWKGTDAQLLEAQRYMIAESKRLAIRQSEAETEEYINKRRMLG